MNGGQLGGVSAAKRRPGPLVAPRCGDTRTLRVPAAPDQDCAPYLCLDNPGAAADACRPHFDNCNRACQRECRGFSAGPWGGPLVGLIDWY